MTWERMRSNSNDHDQSSGETVQLLGTEVTQDGLNSSADGSNAILLPEKKKSNSKDKGKASKKNKNKEVPVLSKSKQRKLKKLEEEKQKKLLQARSIKILEKCKIWDGAYSLLHSSGTIGQAETMKEKRRRAVQLSKAGIDVPEDISPFKKNSQNVSDDNEVTGKLNHQKSDPENVCCDNSVLPAECKERYDGKHSKSVEIHSTATNKSQAVVDIGTDGVPPTMVVPDKEISTCSLEEQKHSAFISSSCDKGHETDSKGKEADDSKVTYQNMKVPPDFMDQEHVNAPIVVHVSRPLEVEEKRKDLPIIMMEQEIMEAINENSIVILCGETGCGKTTQVPQFLYEAGFGSSDHSDRKGIIGVTQPRRVAVLATAKRVSFELGLHLGKEVGFQVRHDKMIGDSCSIKFMTDGILLREVQSDFLLKKYSVIILDEAHERSLNTDILIGMLSRIIKLRQKLYAEQQEKMLSGGKISPENMITQLKLILMSATLRVEDFISNRKLFHEPPPVLEVPVRQFPVTVHFSKTTQEDYLGQAYKKVMSIHKRLPPGGILVFVTGQREVEFLCKKLQRASEQLKEKNSMRKKDNEITASSDLDMKEINEAFEIGSNSLDQQTDRFSSYEEDGNNPDMHSDLSDAESESELEVDSGDEDSVKSEAPEKTGLVLDFLNDVESLSSLKASFEALAGNLSNQDCKEKPSLPDAPSLEKSMEVATSSAGALYVLPLYAMLPASAQLRVFEEVPEGDRLVVVATNVAETSLTIPGIKYVVDTGKEKVKTYNYTNGMAAFEVQWISKASAAQRAGRAGRTGPGHCYRLYSSAAFSKDDLFPDFSCPEISKIPVDGVVLLMKFMGIDKVANFPFPSPPETKALVEAELCLKALEALDSQGRLTPMGRAMAQYPMSPRHSRMLLTVIQIMRNQQGYARANFVLGYAVAAASALSFQNPFLMQFGENHGDNDIDQEKSDTEKMKDQEEKLRQKKVKAMEREARARFCNPSSDALTIAYALQIFELAENSVQFCKENSLHLKTMEDLSKMRKQLLQLIFYQSKFCEEFAWNHGTADDVELSWRIRSDKHPLLMNEEELLGQSICAGWADRVAKRVRTISESSENDGRARAVRYQSCALKDTVFLHRWSSVSRSAPEFLVYTELLQTKRPYMHGVTSVKSDWLVKYAISLCTFSAPLTDPKPYYEPLSDQVFCWVSPTFGQHNWQLPLHRLPIKNDILRASVFACALLEGQVLPCLGSFQKFLAAPPSCLLRPEALGQRRVGDLLSRLKIGSRIIDSRAMLRDAWSQDPQFLHTEIKRWFQERFHYQFGDVWEQMHHEVLLEGCELFPKRAKKGRKKVK
ncbi:ATP-dependent RNA helicase DEAH13 [Phoenix dactylifera]|uniref:RNA helicase n=1 Tax=Phoenix dactylifera TaxID=42345 RepID=A0A8B7MVM6_PHODC|nr:ATP-dependent RNA helicase DEAH13 [Phoenix dactylifera]XP_017699367.2 ATP-dependent RNA helicase DEAH13 [Phoenix dactylifera]XP_038980423.1 ATP-dependent RNA helicase DEAH13 [Phoenix dactylifera]